MRAVIIALLAKNNGEVPFGSHQYITVTVCVGCFGNNVTGQTETDSKLSVSCWLDSACRPT